MKDGRLHLRLSAELLTRAKKMARERGIPLSQLVVSFLKVEVDTYESLKNSGTFEAEQI